MRDHDRLPDLPREVLRDLCEWLSLCPENVKSIYISGTSVLATVRDEPKDLSLDGKPFESATASLHGRITD